MDTFNRQALTAILEARDLTLTIVSSRIGMTESAVESQIEDTSGPTEKVINGLARELAVPSFMFFMDKLPDLPSPLIDFRSAKPHSIPKSRSTIETIDMVRAVQRLAEKFGHADALSTDSIPLDRLSNQKTAEAYRQRLGLSFSVQTDAENELDFYRICRKAVESTGVFVIHESFPSEDGSGFCLADSSSRAIAINTKGQTAGRRTFTLMHELAHALLRSTGISDPFISKNSVERACNLFAAKVLLPVELAKQAFAKYGITANPSLAEISRAAKFLNISQEATIVRFEQLTLVSPGAHGRWLDAVRASGNPDWNLRSGGGRAVPQERVKLAKYGFTFARVFDKALSEGDILPTDIYRASGLKPKYQKPYFSFAKSASYLDAEE